MMICFLILRKFASIKKSKGLDEVPYCGEETRKRAENFALTIDGAFQLIEQYEDSAHTMNIKYHPKFGYPEHINIDIVAEMADEEIHYKFSELKKIIR